MALLIVSLSVSVEWRIKSCTSFSSDIRRRVVGVIGLVMTGLGSGTSVKSRDSAMMLFPPVVLVRAVPNVVVVFFVPWRVRGALEEAVEELESRRSSGPDWAWPMMVVLGEERSVLLRETTNGKKSARSTYVGMS